MGYVEALIFVTIIGYLLHRWCTAKYKVLLQRNIPHDKPIPLLGNVDLSSLFGNSSFIKYTIEHYTKFKDSKIYGIYSFRDPTIIIRDLDLIKKISIKDFDHFPNHQDTLSEIEENILSKSLIMLKDRKWKEMRSTLSPAFTGNKMRIMFDLINECCVECVKHVNNEIDKTNSQNGLDMEVKDFFTRYTNDVIASAAFGIKVNSFENVDNEFYVVGKSLTQFEGWTLIKAILMGIIPKLMKLFGAKLLDEKKIDYFKRLVLDAIKYRESHNILRPDMIQLLMEAKRNFEQSKSEHSSNDEHAEFSDEDLLAQCLLFFGAGFETVSSCLCFTAHELAVNPDVQDKLYSEIMETQQELNGKPINYDTLMNMKYLDQVLSESLRKWPPAIITDRVCTADYKVIDEDGTFLTEIKKKDVIMIPTIAIHHDPEYFENPQTFDPERFSEENKKNLNTNAYMPFGVGNRSCIGNRFALMETKLIIYQLLVAFKIVTGEKTCTDIFNAIKGVQMEPPEKFWVKFVPRPSHN